MEYTLHPLRKALRLSVYFGVCGLTGMASADIADTPLDVGNPPQSNILFLIDDAKNLDYEFLDEDKTEFGSNGDSSRFFFQYANQNDPNRIVKHCYGYNRLAYNPNKEYLPWWGYDSEGNEFADQTDITSVPLDPYLPKSARINDVGDDDALNEVDISDYYYLVWNDNGDGEYQEGECSDSIRLTYGCIDGSIRTGDQKLPSSECVVVSDMSHREQVNFANWYAYHRKKEYEIKFALAEVINPSRARIGLGFTSGTRAGSYTNAPRGTEIIDVDDLTVPIDTDAVSNKRHLLDLLFSLDTGDALNQDESPVRRVYEAAGNYFERSETYDAGDVSGVNQLFGYDASEPEPESPIIIDDASGTCQANATIVVSARYGNGSEGSRYSQRIWQTDVDGDNSSDYDGHWTGTPQDSYADGESDTLADVAMFFYERDLYPDLDDTDAIQRMSSHMIAFGIESKIRTSPSSEGDVFIWPKRANNKITTIDDMRHAAWNGRGQYHEPSDGPEFLEALESILFNVDEVATEEAVLADTSLIAVSSLRNSSDKVIFKTEYSPGTWEGDVVAYPVNQTSLEVETELWRASERIPSASERNVFTYSDSHGGIAFTAANWTLLDSEQQDDLNALDEVVDSRGLERIAYLRGDQSNELVNSGVFRDRASLLGDVINSDPVYASNENYGYNNLEKDRDGSDLYYDYYQTKVNREPIIFFGANDGMLHALRESGDDDEDCNSDTQDCQGEEVFSYIPKGVYYKLSNFTDSKYTHKYYVDGPALVTDAFMDFNNEGDEWGTILVSTLGYGGPGIFALDVTDPLNFDENDVLWDLDDGDLAELGSISGQVTITKLVNDEWAAVFGNGYDSANNKAGLYIVPLNDPSDYTFIDTGADGTDDNPNGLSNVFVADTNGDQKGDRVYAGDLLGNMWVFDLSHSNPNQWDVDYRGDPLFTACIDDACSETQAITSTPQVLSQPEGYVVLFGTGRYLEQEDIVSKQKQAFYGVLDNQSDTVSRSRLVQQSIIYEDYFSESDRYVRVVSEETVSYSGGDQGWYLEFDSEDYPGERVIADPVLYGTDIVFPTFTVDTAICSRTGGDSWFMQLDAVTGQRQPDPPFDTSYDGNVDEGDLVTVTIDGEEKQVATSGVTLDVGLAKTGKIYTSTDGTKEWKFAGSNGAIDRVLLAEETANPSGGRQSWLQIR
ncbi:MAG: pilus assembly protein [Pontibacterium sp.]